MTTPNLSVTATVSDNEWGDGAAEVMAILPRSILSRHGVGVVKPRSSKTASERYLSNGCVHCDALQGRFFESAFEAQTEIVTEAVFKPASTNRP